MSNIRFTRVYEELDGNLDFENGVIVGTDPKGRYLVRIDGCEYYGEQAEKLPNTVRLCRSLTLDEVARLRALCYAAHEAAKEYNDYCESVRLQVVTNA